MLTEEEASQITMFMRVASHLQSNLQTIGENKEMMDGLATLKEALAAIFEQLSEEDRDSLLEQYKSEAEFLGLTKG